VGIDGQVFRAVVGSFPTGVTVVTAVGKDGVPRGLTSNAVCSVSAEPPLLLFCIDKRSNTLDALLEARAFVINFLAAGRGDLATLFASRGGDKFRGLHWLPSGAARGAPILVDDTVAYAECLVSQIIDAGDHLVFIGLVEQGYSNEGTPLMYLRRTYAAWPLEQPAPAADKIHG
jgi:flavin reductase (DIM6/NTAB) family NADH-FMN oxidoreductase RutF